VCGVPAIMMIVPPITPGGQDVEDTEPGQQPSVLVES
jgi:hypothetical protein